LPLNGITKGETISDLNKRMITLTNEQASSLANVTAKKLD
jgi:hypothetical protein